MSWRRGEETIRRLIDAGELDRVPPSDEVVERLLADASRHVALAERGVDVDPAGSLQLAYDGARKAASSLLAAQGLRSTTTGGHLAVIEAAREQFNGPGGVPVFGRIDRLRRRRHDSEYPDADSPGVTEDDATDAIEIARDMIDGARKLLDTGRIDRFD
jgi:hypothetical protein